MTTPGPLGGGYDPHLARLWAETHRRLERTGRDLGSATVRITAPDDDERRSIDLLLRRRSRGRDVTVPLAELERVIVRTAGVSDLWTFIEGQAGPLQDRPSNAALAAAEEEQVWDLVSSHPALARHPELVAWLDRVRGRGRHRRLANPAADLAAALDVLAVLPADQRVVRSRLASSVCGPSHALDDNTPAARLIVEALTHLAGPDADPRSAAGRRRLWSSMGVIVDELSSTVLTAGLRPIPAGPLTEGAARWAASGIPLPVPYAGVQAEPWRVLAGTVVWVCENPSLVATAATGFGEDTPPMVCVEGQPSNAAVDLLAGLSAGGADLRYHGDFGAGGITIGNYIIGRLGARPWRFSADDHADALAIVDKSVCKPLADRVPEALWDPALGPAVRACGIEIEEENLLDVLVADLAC